MSFEKRKRYYEKEDDSERAAYQVLDGTELVIMRYQLGSVCRQAELPTKYKSIAKAVGLKPVEEFRDVGHFELHRARISNGLFADIAQDIFQLAKQYRFPESHKTEEATSRLFSPIFNHIVAQFDGIITNEPSILRGSVVGYGPIKYQFRSFGGLTVLFIEVKLLIGSWDDRLNAIAQVIVGCLACAEENKKNDLMSPVYAILCEGTCFQFFSFDGSTSTPTFLEGKISTRLALPFPDMRAADYVDFLVHIRPICDVIFYIILTGYTTSLNAIYDQSRRQGDELPCRIAEWSEACNYALSTITKAKEAATFSRNGDIERADIASTEALRLLAKSVSVTPRPKLARDIIKDLAEPRVMAA